MKVLKIGGGCLRRAFEILEINNVLNNMLKSEQHLILVVSALGKTTSILDEIVRLFIENKKSKSKKLFEKVKNFHLEIVKNLFPKDENFLLKIENFFDDIYKKIPTGFEIKNVEFILDQILPIGELISSEIVSQVLEKFSTDVPIKLLDAREFIITDNNYGKANISFTRTCIKSICKIRDTFCENNKIIITQGFIGSDYLQGFNTTLGREGSDYTASLLATFSEADEFIKYTNVKGVMTEDPAINPLAKLIPELSYQEFRELQDTEVIGKLLHSKCLGLLERRNIPFSIRPFNDLKSSGTLIH